MNRIERPAPYPSKSTRVLRFALRAVLIAFLLLAFIEAVLRFGLGLGNPVLVTPDAACGYILKPNQHLYRFFSHIDTNRYGMRSAEIPATRSAHTLRVMFLGDSVTYGTSRVDQRRIFTQVLHRDLPAIVHEPVEVLNASAGNWAIDNELSYIRSRGIFQSDVVLLVLNSGDLTQPRATLAQFSADMPVKRYKTAIGEAYSRFIKQRFFDAPDRAEATNANPAALIQTNLADLDAMRSLVVAQHAAFAIVYAPFRQDVPLGSAQSLVILRNWAASRHVPLLDLTAAESPFSEREITLDGEHFNTRGNRIVAEAIEKDWPLIMQSQTSAQPASATHQP